MASATPRPQGQREVPDWVVRYEMGSVRIPVEYHSQHGHAEKLGLVLYENSIAREMARRQDIILTMQDTVDVLEAAGEGALIEELTVEGETLEQHQKALQSLIENGQRASEAFAELSERVLREERARRRRAGVGRWWSQRLL